MVLYSSKFQASLMRLENPKRLELDKTIKDFIGKIRKKRDLMYKYDLLPINAIIETTNYKP